jgi:hypothetical protein
MDTKKQMTLHTNAINLARRLSVQNENDLMQVRRRPVAVAGSTMSTAIVSGG